MVERHEANEREREVAHAGICAEIRESNSAAEEEYDLKLATYKEYEGVFEEWLMACKAVTQRREEAEARAQDTYGALVTRVRCHTSILIYSIPFHHLNSGISTQKYEVSF